MSTETEGSRAVSMPAHNWIENVFDFVAFARLRAIAMRAIARGTRSIMRPSADRTSTSFVSSVPIGVYFLGATALRSNHIMGTKSYTTCFQVLFRRILLMVCKSIFVHDKTSPCRWTYDYRGGGSDPYVGISYASNSTRSKHCAKSRSDVRCYQDVGG